MQYLRNMAIEELGRDELPVISMKKELTDEIDDLEMALQSVTERPITQQNREPINAE